MLVVWILKKLPDRVYKVAAAMTILSMALAACSLVSPAYNPEMPNQNDPVPGETTGLPDSATEEVSSTATIEPSPTATERVLTLEERVDAFATGQVEFPTDLSPEEYSAFIDEMNNHVSRQAIWVESFRNSDGSPVVLYFDVAQSKMVMLSGTYAENREIIDQNQLEMFVKISEEAETGNIQYTNSSGELVTSPNSADVNWNLRVDASNYEDGLISLPKVTASQKTKKDEDWYNNWWNRAFSDQDANMTLVPAILMDNQVSKLVSFQGGWNDYACLNMLFIITNEQGEPLYGIRKMVGPAPITLLGFEEGALDITPGLYELRNSDTIRKFEAGAIYYVGVRNQQYVWDTNNRASIEELQGVASVPQTFNETFNEDFPDNGNVILAASIFVKKK